VVNCLLAHPLTHNQTQTNINTTAARTTIGMTSPTALEEINVREDSDHIHLYRQKKKMNDNNRSSVKVRMNENNLTEITNGSCFTGNCTNDSTVEDNYDPADVIRVIYAAVGSLGMTGNALVIIVIMSSLQMRRSTTNLMITNQSAIDFSASLFILLGTNIRDVDGIRSTIGRELFCRLWAPNILMWGLSVSSTYNLVCITMERYTGIVYPMRHSRTCSRGRAKYAMAFAWFIGLAFNMAYMIPTSPYSDDRCMPYTEWPSLTVQRAVGLLTISLQFFLPVLLIISSYIRIDSDQSTPEYGSRVRIRRRRSEERHSAKSYEACPDECGQDIGDSCRVFPLLLDAESDHLHHV